MKPFESVLGETYNSSGVALFPLGDEESVKQNIKNMYKEHLENILLLFEYGDSAARGYFVKTNSRILFCLTQDINKFKNTFEVKWVIDDIKNTEFVIKLEDENEIKITEDKSILFDTSLYSKNRILKELHNIILPTKTTISKKVEEEIKIHPKIPNQITKIYKFYYSSTFKEVLAALPLKYNIKEVSIENLDKFFLYLSLGDLLTVIKDILDNEDIKRDQYSNWNVHGDFIKHWRPQLIGYLKDNGIDYNKESRTFSLIGGDPIEIITTKRKISTFLDIEFDDFFYNSLKKEINDTYKFGLFTSTMFLSRKLLENLVIEILRTKYPPNKPENLRIYWDKRFHDFSVLIKNIEDRKSDFAPDEPIISEFISLCKPFRPRVNANTHSIVIFSDEEEVLKYKVQKMAALLLKLLKNIRQ